MKVSFCSGNSPNWASEKTKAFWIFGYEFSSNAETDYLIENENEIIPVEIKSGSAGSLKSLHILLNSYPNIQKAFVFSDAQLGELPEQKLTFMPLYFASSVLL